MGLRSAFPFSVAEQDRMMRNGSWTWLSVLPLGLAIASGAMAQQGAATGTLAQRIGHYDPKAVRHSTAVHDGAGSMDFGPILGASALSTNLIFMHRGTINPKSGIGQHFHNHSEEMFVILDNGEAQFTINGRTAVLGQPGGVPDRMGSSHGVYNPTDKPIQWLNINVGTTKTYDTFNLGDDRVGAPLDKVPQFVNFKLDPKALKPVERMNGGTGTVQYRRLLEPTVFFTTWSYVDHLMVPAGATVGPFTPPNMSEAYYVLSGAGTATVNGETAPIKAGDAIPVDIGQSRAFAQTGSAPLELFVVGVAKDMASKEAFIAATMAPRR
jgi:mannose-6-phosphate isomerase-like protein (cupin superfamily)